MPRVCELTGRKTSAGNSYTHRGKPKYLGGVGTKITGKTKRKFRPNIQTVTAVVDGSVKRIKVSTKAMRSGMVVKPLKRKYAYRPTAESEAPPEFQTEPETPADSESEPKVDSAPAAESE